MKRKTVRRREGTGLEKRLHSSLKEIHRELGGFAGELVTKTRILLLIHNLQQSVYQYQTANGELLDKLSQKKIKDQEKVAEELSWREKTLAQINAIQEQRDQASATCEQLKVDNEKLVIERDRANSELQEYVNTYHEYKDAQTKLVADLEKYKREHPDGWSDADKKAITEYVNAELKRQLLARKRWYQLSVGEVLERWRGNG